MRINTARLVCVEQMFTTKIRSEPVCHDVMCMVRFDWALSKLLTLFDILMAVPGLTAKHCGLKADSRD